jgi:hypothetical protein
MPPVDRFGPTADVGSRASNVSFGEKHYEPFLLTDESEATLGREARGKSEAKALLLKRSYVEQLVAHQYAILEGALRRLGRQANARCAVLPKLAQAASYASSVRAVYRPLPRAL